jgi:hypothetical protein
MHPIGPNRTPPSYARYVPKMVASDAMQRVTWSFIVLVGLGACGHRGKMVVDTPLKPYVAPDISEITGIDEDDTDNGSAAAPAPEKAPATAPAAEKK